MTLLTIEQDPDQRGEAQIGRVGMGQREQILAVEKDRVLDLGRDEPAEEAAFELCVVRDQHASFEGGGDSTANLFEAPRSGDVAIAQTREALDHPGQGLVGPDQSALGTHLDDRLARPGESARPIEFRGGEIEGEDAELEDLRRRIPGQTRGLEIHDRDRAAVFEQRRE